MDPAVITAYFLSIVDKWIAEGATQDEVARRVGTSGPFVSQLRSGKRQLGDTVAGKVAAALGVSFGEFLVQAEKFAAAHPDRVKRRETTVHYDDARPQLDRVPGYAEAEAAARKRAPWIPEHAWETTRATRGARITRVDPAMLVELATTWAKVETLPGLPDDGDVPPPEPTPRRKR